MLGRPDRTLLLRSEPGLGGERVPDDVPRAERVAEDGERCGFFRVIAPRRRDEKRLTSFSDACETRLDGAVVFANARFDILEQLVEVHGCQSRIILGQTLEFGLCCGLRRTAFVSAHLISSHSIF
jgi:hypothetical protein